MARLIPSFVDDRTPPGERDVFNMLAAGPNDWVALHSLDLAPWNRGLRTEIDFVVIIPDAGILCIEVKSHERIAFDGNQWQPSQIKRSPFKQATDGRYAFHRRLSKLAPQFKQVPVAHCCIFPRASFDLHANLSVQPWELMDMRSFRACSSGASFCQDLRVRLLQGIQEDGHLNPLLSRLSPAQVEEIVETCVPVRKRRPDAREEILRRAEQADQMLKDQQKPVLQLAALNGQIVVTGGAGTGKTLIAAEVARRAALSGRRVGWLCFNQLAGKWLRELASKAAPAMPNLLAGSAIQVLAEMTEVTIPESASPDFWENELPALLEDRLTDPDLKAEASFDYLVLDEAQDLFARPRLLQCLMHFLTGGMERGAFAIFGDFENQVLSQRDVMDQELVTMHTVARPCRWHLRENCRNYKIVGETAVRLGGFHRAVYSGYLRAGGGVQNCDIAFHDQTRTQLDQIAQWLREFKAQGYKPVEITLLSFCSAPVSAAPLLIKEGFKLRPAWQEGQQTSYCSVHAFKGMENKIIVLTDVVLGEASFLRDLFYTGMTRATESVRIACHRSSQETLSKWLT